MPVQDSPVYDTIGLGYVAHRKADPRWEAVINEQLGDGRVVVNVGAGTGNYEPVGVDRAVIAVEPSSVMVQQRGTGAAPVVRASGSALPLPTRSADVAMAILTVHHWDDWAAGLAEMCRVAPRRLVLTMDFELHSHFWFLEDYVPEVGESTRRLAPGVDDVGDIIGGSGPRSRSGAGTGGGSGAVTTTETAVLPLLVPRDMQDGVLGAYWCRPEAYLDPAVRANCSGLALADPAVVARGVAALEADLSSGAWQQRHADLADLQAIDLGYRLVVANQS